MDTNIALQEEFKLLWRSTRVERNRFIIVQYNHYDLVRQIKADIATKYPNRAIHIFNLKNDIPEQFANELLAIEQGFICIEHFDDILKPDFQTITTTLNQRRDAFRDKNTIILFFLPIDDQHLEIGDKYLKNFSKALPDLYSVVSPIIQLVKTIQKSDSVLTFSTAENSRYHNSLEAQEDVTRIEERLETLEKISSNNRLRFSLMFDLGKANLFLGKYEIAKKNFSDTLEVAQNTLNSIELNNIRAMFAWVENELGNSEVAANILEKILEEDLKYYKSTDSVIAERQNDLANVYGNLGRYEEAAKLLETALQSDLNNFGENHPTVAARQSNLALVYQDLGRYEAAAKLLETALQSDLNNFGKNHPTVAIRQSNLANVYSDLGRYEVAAQLLETALQSALNNFGENHPNVANRLYNLAHVYFKMNDIPKAIELFEKAYLILQKTLGENHPKTKQVKGNLEYVKKMQP